jgi:surface polysaccharide O-acyltransferase-like enzyme
LNQQADPARNYFVDWLRIIAIIMVFLFHNARFFDLSGWEVKNTEVCLAASIVVEFMSIWLMPLFFLLAGGSTFYALRRRTYKEYAGERFYRLIIPYIFGVFFLIPPQRYVEGLNKGWFAIGFGDFLPEYFYRLYTTASTRLTFEPDWLGHFGTHLWFLAELFIFSLLALPIWKLLQAKKGSSFLDSLTSLSKKARGIFVFILPLVLSRILFNPIFHNHASWTQFLSWFLIFSFGYILFSDDRYIENAANQKPQSAGDR